MSKVLWIILGLVCLAGAGFGIAMTVMAVHFMELGRVVFYGAISIACLEAVFMIVLRQKKPKT